MIKIKRYILNTETLLEAFAKLQDKKDWILKIAGPIEKEFEEYINSFFIKNPSCKEKILFLGELDKKELAGAYREAKVFILPSIRESFGLVLVEALSFGDYLLTTTGIPTAPDFIQNETYGGVFHADQSEELTELMQKATEIKQSQDQLNEVISYANENFEWTSIVERLKLLLDKS